MSASLTQSLELIVIKNCQLMSRVVREGPDKVSRPGRANWIRAEHEQKFTLESNYSDLTTIFQLSMDSFKPFIEQYIDFKITPTQLDQVSEILKRFKVTYKSINQENLSDLDKIHLLNNLRFTFLEIEQRIGKLKN